MLYCRYALVIVNIMLTRSQCHLERKSKGHAIVMKFELKFKINRIAMKSLT